MTEICTRYAAGLASPLQDLFAPCPDCGHTGSAHPSIVNPSIEQCQLCMLAVALEEFRDAGQSWINMIADAITAPILEHAAEHHQNDPHGVIPIDGTGAGLTDLAISVEQMITDAEGRPNDA